MAKSLVGLRKCRAEGVYRGSIYIQLKPHQFGDQETDSPGNVLALLETDRGDVKVGWEGVVTYE
jgi:hypothetical protein